MRRGVFVTGTDTGVGKTLACCALLHALAARGIRALPMKPIAAGDTGDTRALMEAAAVDVAWTDLVTPIQLAEPMAPHIAAAREGRAITLAPVMDALERLGSRDDFLVVEGVGGFRVPLADGLDTVDLARAVALPVVMVVGLRLGCINHALLTAQAIEASGLRFAGWIASSVDPAMAVADENVAALRSRLRAPLMGRLPHAANPDARLLAAHLDLGPLFA